MKVVQLVRPALDPRRDLELRMREVQAGLTDFVQSTAPPSGWLNVELLEDDDRTASPAPSRASRRA